MDKVDWTNNTQYMIINGQTIHKDLVGSSIVGTKAYRAEVNGYYICDVCCAMVPNRAGYYTNKKQHEASAVHKNYLKEVKKYSSRASRIFLLQ